MLESSPASSAYPTVSMLCVTEKRAHFMPWLWFNFERQTYAARELIVVGSSASVSSLLDKPGVRHVVTPPGLPVADKRNLALQAAQGEIIAWLDDDDWSHSRRLEELVAALKQGHPYAGPSRAWFVDLFTRLGTRFESEQVLFNGAAFWREVAQVVEFDNRRRRASDSRWMTAIRKRWGEATRYPNELFFWLCHRHNLSNPNPRPGKRVTLAELAARVGDAEWAETGREFEALRRRSLLSAEEHASERC